MSKRRRPPSDSYQAGKRGRHKRRSSPETRAWERTHLLPDRPPWMPEHVYVQLATLRGEL